MRQNGPIDSAVVSDSSLLFGEISSSPLHTIEVLLSSTFSAIFSVSNDWGKVESNQKLDFNNELDSFLGNLRGALDSLSGGLNLRQPSCTQLGGYETMDTRSFSQRVQQNPEMIPYFEELLEEWCEGIDNYLHYPKKNSLNEEIKSLDEGPRGELEYWRSRMQRLISITEQLKRKDCKNVVGLLSAQTKSSSNDQSKAKVVALLRRWKQIDIGITEASNEAKDNVKYLFTLQRFLEPLYTGSISEIVDVLPILLNSIKVGIIGWYIFRNSYLCQDFILIDIADDIYNIAILQYP